jgi:hypothetical protein
MKFEHQKSFRKKVGSYGPYITRPFMLLTHGVLRLTRSLVLFVFTMTYVVKKTFSHNFIYLFIYECSQVRHV